ncbi:uncharacterized protein LOC134752382 isoform X1 [Cydia strobilella]|uniref:uncharacterized protein LOC134752382 isoform X1 n=1 Tax=Cydia strobilella TaxID=1100964 RepID=UPI00300673FB
MAGTFGLISVFNHETQEWRTYKNRLTQWFIANDINDETDKAEVKRRAILISALAESTYRLASNLALPATLEEKGFSDVVKILDAHFTPKRCGYVERFHFYSATQQAGEGHVQWAARLKGLAAHCDFKNMEDAILDKFVMGMLPGREREKLFAQNVGELTLTKAIDLAESIRVARTGGAATAPAGALVATEASSLFQIEKASARSSASSSNVQCSVNYHGGVERTGFNIEDQILYKKYVNKNKFYWIRGKITKKLGQRLYLIEDQETCNIIKKHINQIVLYKGKPTDSPTTEGMVATTRMVPSTQEPTVFLPVPGPVAPTSVSQPDVRPTLPALPGKPEVLDTFHPAEGEEGNNISPEGQCSQQSENLPSRLLPDPQDTNALKPLPPRQAKLNVDFKKYF